ncbi:glucose-methanol-choline oxidoreductase [Nitrosococcus oceani]|nr:glucose-methanol-choline oxidoreductase [Nitrosococcus oceani]
MRKKGTNTRFPADWDVAITRRSFNRGLIVAGFTVAMGPFFSAADATVNSSRRRQLRVVDYIVVGGGAGGGPVAAQLAKAGYTVAVLEAGLDPEGQEALSIDPNTGIIYQVPAFAAVASEHPLLSWDFYVKHYSDPVQQARDSKFVPGKGILYPRGSALGGSTAHDAMLFIYPHNQDWDDIAEMTGDESWRASHMRKYFERLEKCEYCQPLAPGHGFRGYMNASLFDEQVFKLAPEIQDLAEAGQKNIPFEANDPRVAQGATGSIKTPMHIATKVRVSIREHLLDTRRKHQDKLFLITGALATKVLIRGKRAIGVEFMRGNNLYEADKFYDPNVQPSTFKLYARREVILSAGVFNTPQLLKLSGIGPATELNDFGIKAVADLPGVGRSLQDRYEISVVAELKRDLNLYKECLPSDPLIDPCLRAWLTGKWPGVQSPFYGPYANNAAYNGRIAKPNPEHTLLTWLRSKWPGVQSPFYGPYANNAAYNGRIAKSNPGSALPDLFLVGQATAFNGFVPDFSLMPFGGTWTWLILKAHTNNTAGTVTLKSNNPREMPEINFNYFQEGGKEDLQAVVKGVKLARSFLNEPQAKQHVAQELHPGSNIQTDEEISQYIRDQAWGHHASCTAKIGADDDPLAVLDSRFRVRGVKRLRVVDACAFPRVPGFFPVAAIMMIGEKAADVILEDAKRARRNTHELEMSDEEVSAYE